METTLATIFKVGFCFNKNETIYYLTVFKICTCSLTRASDIAGDLESLNRLHNLLWLFCGICEKENRQTSALSLKGDIFLVHCSVLLQYFLINLTHHDACDKYENCYYD